MITSINEFKNSDKSNNINEIAGALERNPNTEDGKPFKHLAKHALVKQFILDTFKAHGVRTTEEFTNTYRYDGGSVVFSLPANDSEVDVHDIIIISHILTKKSIDFYQIDFPLTDDATTEYVLSIDEKKIPFHF